MPSRFPVVSLTAIVTKWYFQLKQILKVFSNLVSGSVKSNR